MTQRHSYHMGISVRGNIAKTAAQLRRDWRGCTDPRGDMRTRTYWLDRLSEGFETIPFDACDRWDPKHGCKGHPLPPAVTP